MQQYKGGLLQKFSVRPYLVITQIGVLFTDNNKRTISNTMFQIEQISTLTVQMEVATIQVGPTKGNYGEVAIHKETQQIDGNPPSFENGLIAGHKEKKN